MAAASDPESSPKSYTVRLRISGRVQGVGYRMWAVATARGLGLTGWVRNLTDGSVEALAQGSHDAVHSFVAACQEGPAWGRVSAVDEQIETTPFEGTEFEQWATASPRE